MLALISRHVRCLRRADIASKQYCCDLLALTDAWMKRD